MELARDSQILVLQPFAESTLLSLSDFGRVHGLIAEIIQGDQVDAEEAKGSSISQVQSSSSTIPWHISNKYYEADVEFRLSKVGLFDSATLKRPARTRRTAQMVTTSEESVSTSMVLDDDEELKKKVRNVFEALEKPGGSFKPRDDATALDEDKRIMLSEEVEGVDAVMMVIDTNQPLRQHQRLLAMLNSTKGEKALLSGFDLAVSIVVALSSPLEEAAKSSGQPPTMEQLSDLYTGEGWEFVDLEEQAAGSEESFSDDEQEGSLRVDEELHGIARIREALQTHIWPDLIRNNDRSARLQGRIDHRAMSQDELPSTRQEGDIESTMALLQVDLGSLDAANAAEPTKEDEDLAEAFLKRILASQAAALSPDRSEGPPSQSLASMQAELEKFLESEDTEWPIALVHQPSESQDEEAWSTGETVLSATTTPAFDDDFSDFVQGPKDTTEIEQTDTELDLDDLALMRALEREQPEFGAIGSASAGMNFESTLSAVMAQAERVRSISDRQKRREEAARVALTLLGEQP